MRGGNLTKVPVRFVMSPFATEWLTRWFLTSWQPWNPGRSSLTRLSRVRSYHIYLEALWPNGLANVFENSVAIWISDGDVGVRWVLNPCKPPSQTVRSRLPNLQTSDGPLRGSEDLCDRALPPRSRQSFRTHWIATRWTYAIVKCLSLAPFTFQLSRRFAEQFHESSAILLITKDSLGARYPARGDRWHPQPNEELDSNRHLARISSSK